MKKFPRYEGQVLPDKLNTYRDTFTNDTNLLEQLKEAKKKNTTVYAYCYSSDTKTGTAYLEFLEGSLITGYIPREEITYLLEQEGKVHVGRSNGCVDNLIGVKILDIEENDDKIAVKCSRKKVVEAVMNKYNKDIESGVFKEGMLVKGIVTGMDFNKVYIDIGGDVTAILGVADIARVYVREPSDLIEHGEVLDLVVKKAYAHPIKVSLSREMLLQGWESIDSKFKVGRIVPGIIKNTMPTGIFIELSESFEGIAEEIPTWKKLKYGDRVKVHILHIDKKREKIKLRIIKNY